MIQESARRALADGVDRDAVLSFVEQVRPQLAHLKIALLADWRTRSRTCRCPSSSSACRSGCRRTAGSRHAAALASPYYEAARSVGQPIVTTCYSSSQPEVIEEAADNGTAYIYLVSAYGKSGTVGPPDHSALAPVMQTCASARTSRSPSGSASRPGTTSTVSVRSAPTRRSWAAHVSPASRTRLPTDAMSSKISRPCSSSWGQLPS